MWSSGGGGSSSIMVPIPAVSALGPHRTPGTEPQENGALEPLPGMR